LDFKGRTCDERKFLYLNEETSELNCIVRFPEAKPFSYVSFIMCLLFSKDINQLGGEEQGEYCGKGGGKCCSVVGYAGKKTRGSRV
jgi:hypothetical protein